MKYPLEKYHFYEHTLPDGTIETIAASTYCGKLVKGRAKCHPADEYSVNIAKNLSAMRCNVKIAEKRFDRAQEALEDAKVKVNEAIAHLNEMTEYYADSDMAFTRAKEELIDFVNKIKNH